jgi:signal transduction histidine kinase
MTANAKSEAAAPQPRRRADRPDELSQAMLDISDLFESAEPLDVTLKRIVEIAAELMDMPICSIYLIEPDGTLRKRSNIGLQQDLKQQATFKLGEGIPGWVAQNGKLVALPDITQDARYALHPNPIMVSHAYICAPLRGKDRVIGVMSAREMAVKNFTRTECRVFQTVASMAAIVIEKQRLIEARLRDRHLAAVATSLSEIAHYIKNVMFTEQIAEKTVGDAIEGDNRLAPIHPSWRNLKRANQRIHKLVIDMLTYTRERALQLEDADLNALVSQTVNDLRDHALKHRVGVSTDLDPSLGNVRLDPSVMVDVLLNLITNAIDAVPEGRAGRVVVRTRKFDGGHYRIEVEDNGAGIPKEIQHRIFTLFFTTKGERGTGIGLAATRKAVEKHGGEIAVESRLGEGTVFRVTLPLLASVEVPTNTAGAGVGVMALKQE